MDRQGHAGALERIRDACADARRSSPPSRARRRPRRLPSRAPRRRPSRRSATRSPSTGASCCLLSVGRAEEAPLRRRHRAGRADRVPPLPVLLPARPLDPTLRLALVLSVCDTVHPPYPKPTPRLDTARAHTSFTAPARPPSPDPTLPALARLRTSPSRNDLYTRPPAPRPSPFPVRPSTSARRSRRSRAWTRTARSCTLSTPRAP